MRSCKGCSTEFTPSKGFVNYCSHACKPRPNVGGWNKGKTFAYKPRQAGPGWKAWLASDEFKRSQKEKADKGRAVIETMKEEVAEKKSQAMLKFMEENDYHPEDNAGWGGGGRPRSHKIEYQGAFVSQEMYDHLTKE